MNSLARVAVRTWLYRALTGRLARRVYLALVLSLIVFSTTVRVRTYLLTQDVYAVLSGLEQLRVDATTDSGMLRAIPAFPRNGQDRATEAGVERKYFLRISNEDELRWIESWVPEFIWRLWPPRRVFPPIRNKGDIMPLARRALYMLGGRQVVFTASVTILNGVVSGMGYSLEPDVRLGFPVDYLVTARSMHGVYIRPFRVPVHSADDESPDFRFGEAAGRFSYQVGEDKSISVAYTPNAPPDLVAHVFQVDLRCFWGLRGCDSVRQVIPLLLQDRQAIEEATAARFKSANPCPDAMLAGRVRTLPDLNIALLEVTGSRSEEVNIEGDRTNEWVTDYRLVEAIRGQPKGPWTNIRYRSTIPWPLSPTGRVANPMHLSNPKPGARFLFFSGANFDSCRIVPATPSAESAVRVAIPPPRRSEDDISWTRGRR